VTALDWIIVVALALSLLLGLMRGFVRELLSLAGWAIGIVLALHYAADLGRVVPLPDSWHGVRTAIAAVVLIVLCVLVAGLVGWLARRVMVAAKLSGTDRMLGALFGAVRGVLVLLAMVWFAHGTDVTTSAWWRQSALLPYAESALRSAAPWLPDIVQRKVIVSGP
jgi:membrane protein required for colicin V production